MSGSMVRTAASMAAKSPELSLTFLPILPAELWLYILGQATITEAKHHWTTVHLVSRDFKAYVERLFTSSYLPCFRLSLFLPCRDQNSGICFWPESIPKGHLDMTFDSFSPDRRDAVFASPLSLDFDDGTRSIEELRKDHVLCKDRSQKAAELLVFTKDDPEDRRSMQLPKRIDWDEVQKICVWNVELETIHKPVLQDKAQAQSPYVAWLEYAYTCFIRSMVATQRYASRRSTFNTKTLAYTVDAEWTWLLYG